MIVYDSTTQLELFTCDQPDLSVNFSEDSLIEASVPNLTVQKKRPILCKVLERLHSVLSKQSKQFKSCWSYCNSLKVSVSIWKCQMPLTCFRAKSNRTLTVKLPTNLEKELIQRVYIHSVCMYIINWMSLANQNLLKAIIRLVNVIYVAVGLFPVSGDFKKEIVSAKRKFDLTEKGKWWMFFYSSYLPGKGANCRYQNDRNERKFGLNFRSF